MVDTVFEFGKRLVTVTRPIRLLTARVMDVMTSFDHVVDPSEGIHLARMLTRLVLGVPA